MRPSHQVFLYTQSNRKEFHFCRLKEKEEENLIYCVSIIATQNLKPDLIVGEDAHLTILRLLVSQYGFGHDDLCAYVLPLNSHLLLQHHIILFILYVRVVWLPWLTLVLV